MKNKETGLSAEALKNLLWETINDVKNKKIDPSHANAIAGQSREIMRVVKTELSVLVLSGSKPSQKMINFATGQGEGIVIKAVQNKLSNKSKSISNREPK